MPLDPQIKAILELLQSVPGRREMSQGTPEEGRAGMRALLAYREGVTPIPVKSVEDITVDGGDGSLRARVYRPDEQLPVPTVVFFHGGGWVIGDLDTHDSQCRYLCRDAGCVVVSVDYRLAPEHPFPAAVDDAYAATEWAYAHVDELGGDATRLAVAGDSAGGNLAAVTALLARDRGGPLLAAQLLIYPTTDAATTFPSAAENATGYFLTRDDMQWFRRHYLPDESTYADPRVSPLRAESLNGLAPAVIGTAEFDPLRDPGNAYAERLADSGVKVVHHCFPGMVHGFFGFAVISDGARAAADQLIADFRGLLNA